MTLPSARRPGAPSPAIALGCVVLFLVPFAAGGVFGAVQAYQAMRRADWAQAGMLTMFALAFGGVGVGGIAAALSGRRRMFEGDARRANHPGEPWLWRPEWAARRIPSATRAEVWWVWAFAVLWNLVSLPAAIVGTQAARAGGHRAALVALLFPLVGLGLLAWAMRATLRQRRYGTTILELSTLPAVIGHTLEGTVRTPAGLRPPEGFLVTLTCLRRTSSGAGRSRSTSESVLWQEEQRVAGTGVGVPVAFAIPADAIPADPLRAGDRVFWRLNVSAEVPGVDYAARFEVPVFRTAASSAPPSEAERAIAAASAVPADYHQPAGSRIEVTQTRRGTELWFPRARNPGAAAALTVFTVIWLGAFVLLVALRAPVIFPIVFGAFGVLLVIGVLDQWLAVTHVTAGDGVVTVASGLVMARRERVVRASEVGEIVPRIAMQSGMTPYYDLSIVTKEGQRIAAGRGIRDKREAEWLAATLRRALGLV